MLKYVDTKVTFSEIPDEITLCINITGCKNGCKGCHSPYLADDIGIELTIEELTRLGTENDGITCIALMGGDSNPKRVNRLAKWIIEELDLKSAWYSGRPYIPDEIEIKNFNYIKLGPYIEELGALNNPNTNQKFYEVNRINKLGDKYILSDVTYKFWKNGKEDN